jgi:hypothetical protein
MSTTSELEEIFRYHSKSVVRVGMSDVKARFVPVRFEDAEAVVAAQTLAVVRSGGALAIVEDFPKGETVNQGEFESGSNVRYGANLKTEFFLYHFFNCDFRCSLGMMPVLCRAASGLDESGLPFKSRAEVIEAISRFLAEMYGRQEIAIVEYLFSGIAVRQIGIPRSNWRLEAERALDFTKRDLGIEYSPGERRGYLEQFTQFGFFTIPVR